MLWIVLSVIFLGVAYYLATKPNRYWIEKGVKQSSPWPIVGDSLKTLMRTQSFTEFIQYVYNLYPGTRYTGIYQFLTPTLIVRDPDLIKQIAVKDFDHFLDHRNFISAEADPLFARNLFVLKGQKWRDMRTTLSPAFTSSKMKQMFALMSDAAEQFAAHFLKKNEDTLVANLKDSFTRFTNDVIASTAFGVKCDSLLEPDNEFYLMGKEATDFTKFWRNFKFFGYFLAPKLFSLFKVRLFDENVSNFFYNLVTDNIASREKKGIVRPDLIHLLMEARKNGLKYEEDKHNGDAGFATVQESEFAKVSTPKAEITDIDIAAQALVFFFAGFDSVSNLMCFMAYEIGVNPDVQERLFEEIDETYHECHGKLTYEALSDMKYMDMVVSESLRKWPNAVATDRICTKPYVIEPKTPDESPLHLKEGDVLMLPIFAIHRDPQHYPDPEKFDPERFSDANKHKIKPYTYLPFGVGPRNCIGSRFALLETKALIFYILLNFEIVPVEKTQIPLKIDRKQFNLFAEGGFWFGLKRRNRNAL